MQRENRVQPHQTSRQELDALRALVERDLKDAGLAGLSVDRRFATAYNAVLQLAKMVIACAGWRVRGEGHHRTTFEALELALGPGVAPIVTYFDACRRKRNQVEYDLANVASQTEAGELLRKAEEFRQLVAQWIAAQHPHLLP